ncbi:MAG TPA: choice-of-anchor tandem repeat GloVer-containing protein, partial [Methylocella sp.]|nr:choice-of-anchor tandem repeat GloVer-containing protein [Methylocella sp.]
TSNAGTVFKLAPDGTETVLHAFKGSPSDGSNPSAGLIFDSSGNLYGTTHIGGVAELGTVFKLAPDGTETVLHSFEGPGDGIYPVAGLIFDSSSNLYGTTVNGGATLAAGAVFKLAPDGTETVLHSFRGHGDGANPFAGLIADSQGNLYGTTPSGGSSNCGAGCGTVFKLAPDGTSYKVLYTFAGGSDGFYPYAGLIADSQGNLYGTTTGGGANDSNGTVFKLTGTGFDTTCTSGDAALANKRFPVLGELTYEISSPTRILQSIRLTASTNIGSYTLPTISASGHSATGGVFKKSDPNATATFELEATFITPSFACAIDPTTATIEIEKGDKAVLGVKMVPSSEHFIEIDNGAPGLNWLRIEANGKYFRSLSLAAGKISSIDASAAMNGQENTLIFTGEGKTGAFANIDLSDSAPQTGTQQAPRGQGTGTREKRMFGF